MQATINGIAMNYAVSGREGAPAVVLHHPLATDLTVWDELTAALEGRYRVVRFDARGHGKTAVPAGPYAFETLASDVIGLMNHLKIAKAQFVGLSMGGFVGQYLGLLHPGRFLSLTLASTSSRTAPEARALWQDRVRIAGSEGMAALVDGILVRWVTPAGMTGNPALVARLRKLILATAPAGYAAWSQAISGFDVTDRIGAIKLPVLVVAGAVDPATPPAGAEVIHTKIAGSRLEIVPDLSHMLHVESPAVFHAHVLPFLAAHAPMA